MVESNTDKDLNQSLQIATKYEKVKNKIVKEYENINKFKKKDILNVAYKRGEIFKWFKESSKFVERTNETRASKSTIYFKIKLVEILKKYMGLKKSWKQSKKYAKKVIVNLDLDFFWYFWCWY